MNLLPKPTRDLDRAEHDIATYGLCLVEDVLSADQLRRARTALYKAAADDRAQGREQPRFGLDYGDANQRVWNVPEPWPPAPQGVNVAWCLDEFSAQNGGTRVVPRSHLRSRNPMPSDVDESVPIEASPGTMMVFESRVWHRTGRNTTASTHRAGLFGWYTRPIYRTQENWFLALDASVREDASDTLLQLLAYKTEGLGLVNGRSPM